MKTPAAAAALSLALIVTASAGPIEELPPKSPVTGPVVAVYDPVDHWEIGYETAALWKFGSDATPLHYTFLPQIITIKTGPVLDFRTGGGRLVVRNRFSLLGEAIVDGPESYFFGVTGGASVEWWNAPRTFSLFLSAGGGIGVLDARGYDVAGAQGQDFNLTWYIHSGLRWRFSDHLSASLGAYFQHISNGGQDKVNPGVNAIGPTLGMAWHF
ncbi:MAG: acyloxyacyl hydrolase [Verrucomicrobiaceae bacterium]|nr:acyloxyacyl hydrolase [Verrucomicrobiaceae bacterium]